MLALHVNLSSDKIWFVQSTFESTLKENYKFEGQRHSRCAESSELKHIYSQLSFETPMSIGEKENRHKLLLSLDNISGNWVRGWYAINTIGKILSDTRARLGVKINVLATSTTRLQPWKRDHHPMEKFLVPKCRKISLFRQNKLLTN